VRIRRGLASGDVARATDQQQEAPMDEWPRLQAREDNATRAAGAPSRVRYRGAGQQKRKSGTKSSQPSAFGSSGAKCRPSPDG
jgi:hypothetical protein